jgi:hypothetical protein
VGEIGWFSEERKLMGNWKKRWGRQGNRGTEESLWLVPNCHWSVVIHAEVETTEAQPGAQQTHLKLPQGTVLCSAGDAHCCQLCCLPCSVDFPLSSSCALQSLNPPFLFVELVCCPDPCQRKVAVTTEDVALAIKELTHSLNLGADVGFTWSIGGFV